MAKQNTVFINRVSEKLVHPAQAKDGSSFYNLSIPYEKSKDGFLHVTLRTGQVLNATKKADNSVIEGWKNILLGNPDTTRRCSYCTKLPKGKRKGEYDEVELTNTELAALFEENRAAYKAAQKAQKAEAETAPATAEADEPIDAQA